MKKIIMVILVIILIFGFIYIKNYSKDKPEKNTKKQVKEVVKNDLVSYNKNLKVLNNKLVNSKGENIVLRGVSTHGIQWYRKFANEHNMKILRDEWGANVFRIAMYTSEGGYLSNNSIKNDVKEIVDIAIDLDMYVIIDWHILSDGNPMDHIEEAKIFFSEMSKKYKNTPNIIYEICNEPNGNITWSDNVKPYAEEITKIIRKNSNNIIIVGTTNWCQNLEDALYNPLEDNNTMYALHFYSGTHGYMRDKIKNIIDKIPIFVSEWGTGEADGNGQINIKESDEWLSVLKENNISWVNWSLSDKAETTAILKPNTDEYSLDDENLTESGKYIKKIMQSYK